MSSAVNPQELQATALAITKAIGYTENGGKPDPKHTHAGKTGELKSVFQFEPATWKAYAKKYLGDSNAPITPDNETQAVLKHVTERLQAGETAKQIASEFNSGDKEAYTGKFSDGSPSIGVNKKYGVKFNVPAYANTVNNYAKQFMQSGQQTQQQAQPPSESDPLQSLMAIVKQAQQPTQAKTPQPNPNGLMGQAASQLPTNGNNNQSNV